LKVSLVTWHAAIAPVLVQLSKTVGGGYGYNPVAVNFLVELVKTTVAFIVLLTLVRDLFAWRHPVCVRHPV
jgi:hypothetical protein